MFLEMQTQGHECRLLDRVSHQNFRVGLRLTRPQRLWTRAFPIPERWPGTRDSLLESQELNLLQPQTNSQFRISFV
eukprot:s6102_g9.t1